MPFVNLTWSAPLQIALSMYFMYLELGNGIWPGLAVILLVLPLNFVVVAKVRSLQSEQMRNKDKRIKLMDELLNGIKVIKLYGWEPSFLNQVQEIRRNEVAVLKKAAWVNAASSFVWTSLPFLVMLVSFVTYIFMDGGNILTADKAFVTLTYMNSLQIQMAVLPMLIVYLAQAGVSMKRVNKFLNNDELDEEAVQHDPEVYDRIQIKNGSFKWVDNGPLNLEDINFSVKPGSLTAVVGTVGSGKSSLLGACLGDMVKVSGDVNVLGSIAYVPQQAW